MTTLNYTEIYKEILSALTADHGGNSNDYVTHAKLVTDALWQIYLSTSQPSEDNNYFSNTKLVISDVINSIKEDNK